MFPALRLVAAATLGTATVLGAVVSAPAAGGITADTVAQIIDAHGRPTRAPPPPGTPAGRSRSTAPVQFAASGTLTVRATDRNGTRLTLTRAIRAG